MAPVRESGIARAAVGGALWAVAISGPPFPTGVQVAVELGGIPAALGRVRVPPPGSAGAATAGFELVVE